MEIRSITAQIQCQVSGGEGHLSADVDSRAWGLNGGRSQYYPDDEAWALIYISKNVSIAGVVCIGKQTGTPTSFTIEPAQPLYNENIDAQQEPIYQQAKVGYNVQREGITFNSPVSSISKPPFGQPIILGQDFHNCGNPNFLLNTTIVRLKTWTSTLDPRKIPPHGYMFVEYTPSVVTGVFRNLGIPDGIKVFSYPNTAIIYGVASPLLP